MTDKIVCEWQVKASLGEGPTWVERENAIYWLDIVGQQVFRLSLDDGSRHSWSFDFEITALAPREQGGFVCTLRDGFAFIDDFDEANFTVINSPEADIPGNRFNDGKVDSQGRFWAGSMNDEGVTSSGALYCLDTDLSLNKLDDQYIITNGPAFSPDGKTLYHNDTIRRCIYAYDVDDMPGIRNRRVLVQFGDASEGLPDGLTVDSEGFIWQASFAGYRITRFTPEGVVDRIIPMPVPNITSCTFAGVNLDTLYITTARILLSEEELTTYPLAGSLFSFKPGVKGLPAPLFKG